MTTDTDFKAIASFTYEKMTRSCLNGFVGQVGLRRSKECGDNQ